MTNSLRLEVTRHTHRRPLIATGMGVEDKIGFEPEPRHFHYPIDSGKPPNFSYCLFFVADVLIGTRDTSRTQLGKHGVMLCARLYYCMVLPANLVGTDPAFQTHTKLICCCRCRCVYNSCLLPLAPLGIGPNASSSSGTC